MTTHGRKQSCPSSRLIRLVHLVCLVFPRAAKGHSFGIMADEAASLDAMATDASSLIDAIVNDASNIGRFGTTSEVGSPSSAGRGSGGDRGRDGSGEGNVGGGGGEGGKGGGFTRSAWDGKLIPFPSHGKWDVDEIIRNELTVARERLDDDESLDAHRVKWLSFVARWMSEYTQQQLPPTPAKGREGKADVDASLHEVASAVLEEGCRVEVVNTSRADLNGQEGTVVHSEHNANKEKERWQVKLDSTGKTLALKEANLKLKSVGSGASNAGASAAGPSSTGGESTGTSGESSHDLVQVQKMRLFRRELREQCQAYEVELNARLRDATDSAKGMSKKKERAIAEEQQAVDRIRQIGESPTSFFDVGGTGGGKDLDLPPALGEGDGGVVGMTPRPLSPGLSLGLNRGGRPLSIGSDRRLELWRALHDTVTEYAESTRGNGDDGIGVQGQIAARGSERTDGGNGVVGDGSGNDGSGGSEVSGGNGGNGGNSGDGPPKWVHRPLWNDIRSIFEQRFVVPSTPAMGGAVGGGADKAHAFTPVRPHAKVSGVGGGDGGGGGFGGDLDGAAGGGATGRRALGRPPRPPLPPLVKVQLACLKSLLRVADDARGGSRGGKGGGVSAVRGESGVRDAVECSSECSSEVGDGGMDTRTV